MLMLQLENVILSGGVGRTRYPLQSCLQCCLTLLVLPLAIQVRAGRHLLTNSYLCQSRFLSQNMHICFRPITPLLVGMSKAYQKFTTTKILEQNIFGWNEIE